MRARSLLQRIQPVLVLIAAIWAIELINQLLGHRLNFWLGLEPRSARGLIGIPAMPLLHGGIDHVIANTLPLAALGILAVAIAPRRFLAATAVIVLVSGLAVWALGRPNSIHIGASGLVFGWFGFLAALGFAERRPRAIFGSVLVIALYSGMVWGALPRFGTTTSWEAHLFGGLAGAGIAWNGRPRSRRH